MNTLDQPLILPESVLTKSQRKSFGPKPVNGYAPGATITAEVRYDDQFGNGRNTFAITGIIRGPGRGEVAGGCLHDEIAQAFPELAPLIKWHLCSAGGPMHYLNNTIYMAGERDYNGLLKDEFRQHTSRGQYQNGGVEGVPNWVLELPDRQSRDVYSPTKPGPVTLEWKAYGGTGEGKARELDAARACAIWPEATDAELSVDPESLKMALLGRLPGLMAEFKAAVESLGFTY